MPRPAGLHEDGRACGCSGAAEAWNGASLRRARHSGLRPEELKKKLYNIFIEIYVGHTSRPRGGSHASCIMGRSGSQVVVTQCGESTLQH